MLVQIGSLCDSTELDGDDTLGRLWGVLLPSAGAWRDAPEPQRSARLCQALIARLAGPHTAHARRPPRRSRSVQSHPLRSTAPPQLLSLRAATISHTLPRRSGELTTLRRSSLGSDTSPSAGPASPGVTPTGWLSPVAGTSPARRSMPSRLAAQPRAERRPSTGVVQPSPALAAVDTTAGAGAGATGAEPRGHGVYAQISDDLDTLLSCSPVRHPSALSSLRSVSMQLAPRHSVVTASMRSRSAHALAAVAEDPGTGPTPAEGERPLTANELSTLQRRRIMRGLMSWRHKSRSMHLRHGFHRSAAVLDGSRRAGASLYGSEASGVSTWSPLSAASADPMADGSSALASVHTWSGVCVDQENDDADSADGRAASDTCRQAEVRSEQELHGAALDWKHLHRSGGVAGAGSRHLDEASDTAQDRQQSDGSRLSSAACQEAGLARARDEERNSIASVVDDEMQAVPLVHALLNRIINHWGT